MSSCREESQLSTTWKRYLRLAMEGAGGAPIDEYLDLVAQRAAFLERLSEAPAEKRDLIDALDSSRSTVDRAVRDLERAGLVTYQDGRYEATAAGHLAVREHRRHVERADDVRAARAALAPLSPDDRLDPAAVVDAEVTLVDGPWPYDALDTLRDDLGAADRVRAVLPDLADPRNLELYRDRARAGVDVTTVLSPRLAGRLADGAPGVCRELATTEGYTALEASVPPFGVVLVDRDGTTAVTTVVYDEGGSVHAVVRSRTDEAVRWAERLYQRTAGDGEDVTASFRALAGATDEPTAAEPPADTSGAEPLPVTLASEGVVELTDRYFQRREPAAPATAWRAGLGLPEVAAGHAVDRTRPTETGRESLTGALTEQLRAGTDVVVLGPLGAGKSTICKSVAHRWYQAGDGPVLYRESGRGDPLESVAAFRTAIEARSERGHVLVVVEDAVRPEAQAVLELVRAFEGDEDVTFLLDARESEWTDPTTPPADPRLDALRTTALERVRVPALDEAEVGRFLEHFEATTGATVPAEAAELLAAVRDRSTGPADEPTGTTAAAAGEVLLLFHRLSRYAAASTPADGEATALLEDVRAAYRRVTDSDAPYATRVAVLVNLLNAAGVGVYPEYVHALADGEDHAAVERRLEELYGEVVFSDPSATDGLAPLETVHAGWSVEFLARLLEDRSRRRAHALVADCLEALLGLAADPDRRADVEWFFEGRRDRLDAVAADPKGWCADVLADVFGVGIERPALAPLFGTTGYARLELPAVCPPATVHRVPFWRGRMYTAAGDLDRAETELREALARLADGSLAEPTRTELAAAVRDQLGRVLVGRGDDAAAGTELAEAERLYGEVEDERGAAGCLVERGLAAKRQGDVATAERRFREALSVYEDHPDPRREARCRFELGLVSQRQGDPEDGREQLRRALELAREAGARTVETRCLNGLGTVAFHAGEIDRAAERFTTAREVAAAVGDRRNEANAALNLSNVARAREEYDRAEELLHEALPLFEAAGDETGVAGVHHNLGDVAEEAGRLETAEEHLERAIEIRERNGHERRLPRSRHNLGSVCLKRGDHDRARRLLEDSLERFREFEEPRMVSAGTRALARLALAEDAPERARELAEESVSAARAADAVNFALAAYEELVSAQTAAGDETAAAGTCRTAAEYAAAAGHEERAERLEERARELEPGPEARE